MLKPAKSEAQTKLILPIMRQQRSAFPPLRGCTRGCTKWVQQHPRTPFFVLQQPRI